MKVNVYYLVKEEFDMDIPKGIDINSLCKERDRGNISDYRWACMFENEVEEVLNDFGKDVRIIEDPTTGVEFYNEFV